MGKFEKGLDQWIASLYGLNVDKFPVRKPEGMPKAVFHEMMAKYKKREDRLPSDKKDSSNNEVLDQFMGSRNSSKKSNSKNDKSA